MSQATETEANEFYREGRSRIEQADRTQEAVDFPKVVLIDNMSACNLRCSMCDHDNIRDYRKMIRMDKKLFQKIIDEVAEKRPDARVWMIFFGEPALCRDMDERIFYAKEAGLTDVVLNSNGCLVDEKKAKAWIQAGLDALYVGVDAYTPESYEKIRVGGDYETTVANVLRYRDLLKEFGRPEQRLYGESSRTSAASGPPRA
jgi:MoaA/NifB/PqqE/SkfB family radical SAM enzyme